MEEGEGIPSLQHGWFHGCNGASRIFSHHRSLSVNCLRSAFHGKSVPPVGREWWSETYRLDGDFAVHSNCYLEALGLDQPVFMGCSVGGLLALDLAQNTQRNFGQ